MNLWTLALVARGYISLTGIVFAHERQSISEPSLAEALAEPRAEIDELDRVLVLVLLQRSRLVAKIGKIKAQKKTNGQPNVRDCTREAQKMVQIRKMCEEFEATDREAAFIQTCIRTVIEVSVQSQQPVDLSPFAKYNCPNCRLQTAGLRDNPLNWPTCPACKRELTIKVG